MAKTVLFGPDCVPMKSLRKKYLHKRCNNSDNFAKNAGEAVSNGSKKGKNLKSNKILLLIPIIFGKSRNFGRSLMINKASQQPQEAQMSEFEAQWITGLPNNIS